MVLGITGTIGSGKSTVAHLFEDWGASVICADRIGWKVLENKEIKDDLVLHFGREILDDERQINRKILGLKAFADPAQLERLNRIVHPSLLRELKKEIESRVQESKPVVVDAALIVEWGITDWFDKVIVVTCPDSVKVERMVEGGMSEDEARRRLAHQLKDEERVKCADHVIDNSDDLVHLEATAKELFDSIFASA